MGLFSNRVDGRHLNLSDSCRMARERHNSNLEKISVPCDYSLKCGPSVELSEPQKDIIRQQLSDCRNEVSRPVFITIMVVVAIISISIGAFMAKSSAVQVGIFAGGISFFLGGSLVYSHFHTAKYHGKALRNMELGNYKAYLHKIDDKIYAYDSDTEHYYADINGIDIIVNENFYRNITIGEDIFTVFIRTDEGECLVLVPCICRV